MAVSLLGLIESIRLRLDDFGGDTGPPSAGYYAYWQEDDSGCLWKNTELVAYLKRALLDIAGRAPWIEEGASDDALWSPTRRVVMAGNPEVSLDETTLTVEQARLVSSGALLEKTESGRLAAANGKTWTTLTGTPTHYLEPRRGLLRLYPIPVVNDELRLIVKRRTIDEFEWANVATASNLNFTLDDIPADIEEALVIGVCRLAYLKRDTDTFQLELSNNYTQQLTELVGPPVSWRQKEARRANANMNTAIRGHSYHKRTVTDDDW